MNTSSPPSLINRQVAEYYGKTLTSSKDLKTNACCTAKSPPNYIRDAIANIHDTVMSKYYGCGLCLPTYNLNGLVVLDLGCGAGRDVYIASQLVGPTGRVVGIDMTPELLAVARDTQAFHAEKFGFDNVEFYQGYLETMNEIKELEKGSFDLIISNCVINLCADKEAVLRHCRDLLKPSGELYFSDVYSNRRIPQALREDPVLWGECLSGALYWNDFENLARRVGFQDPRLVEDALITVNSAAVQRVMNDVGAKGLQFYSATYRLWNMPATLLESQGEDYGQAVSYKGTVARHPSGWLLDKHHYFETGRIVPVSGNTYNVLKESLLKDHFEFVGTFDTHFGIFGGRRAAGEMPFDAMIASGGKGGASCKMKGGCSAL